MKGQSLIELLVAVAVFVSAVSSLAFFILNSYATGRLAGDITKADFLAAEGLEAARSIRDGGWENVLAGSHGLAVAGDRWVFQGAGEDISSRLKGGARQIIVEDIDSDRKKITSRVSWQFTESRPQEVELVLYLTNWQKTAGPQTCQSLCEGEGYLTGNCQKADKCSGLNLGEAGGCAPPPPNTICCCE